MLTTIVKELSLDDLMKMLADRQRQLWLSKMNKAGANLINYNQRQLEQVQIAMADKWKKALPL